VAERSPAREKCLVERADPLRDDPAEPPYLRDVLVGDSLTLVREHSPAQLQARWSVAPTAGSRP